MKTNNINIEYLYWKDNETLYYEATSQQYINVVSLLYLRGVSMELPSLAIRGGTIPVKEDIIAVLLASPYTSDIHATATRKKSFNIKLSRVKQL